MKMSEPIFQVQHKTKIPMRGLGQFFLIVKNKGHDKCRAALITTVLR